MELLPLSRLEILMSYKFLFSIIILIFSPLSFSSNSYLALCYHDVRDDVNGIVDHDQMAVSTNNLIAQFEWLKTHNYHAISLDDVIAAKQGKKELPENAFLLTFDDGYKSFYTHVLPLLQEYNYPAVLALVGKWLETPADQDVIYGDHDIKPRSFFLTREEIKHIQQSKLVEIASHSYDLHHGVLANPQGNSQPAATSLQFNKVTNSYESADSFNKRVFNDLKQNNHFIRQLTGQYPRTMVWPYGAYSHLTENMAHSLGLRFSLTLDDGTNSLKTGSTIKRILITGNPSLSDFVYSLHHPLTNDPIRVAHVDLDYVYDPDLAQENRNLDLLLDRIKAMKINTVFLQAFADPDGDGNADALYFPNRHMPVRKDLFNRVAWQLQTRSQVNVYAWMPVLSFVIPGTKNMRVQQFKNDRIAPVESEYLRLSPFNKQTQTLINEIYQDLAMHANFSGLLFHDDAYLNDFEDLSPEALSYAASAFKKPDLTANQLLDSSLSKQWSALKTKELTLFTLRLANQVKYYRPKIKTARNMYANVVMDPKSELWFSQNYPQMLRSYDYTAIMAMPYMEKAPKPLEWLSTLSSKVKKFDPLFTKTLFELQSVDWLTEQAISNQILKSHFRLLMQSGITNIGYYPDKFLDNHPQLKTIQSSLSLNTTPFQAVKND